MIINIIKKYFDALTQLFLVGLFTLLPITITLSFFSVSFKFIKNTLEPLKAINIPFLINIPHFEIILCLGIIILLGLLLKSLLIKSCMDLGEKILSQIPIFKTIYTSVKQITSAFSPSDENNLKKVVLVKFPQNQTYGIGFLTNELPSELAPEKEISFYTIFIPTSPNPTSGFFIIAKKEDFIVMNISSKDAMAMIISGGMILPKKEMV